MNIIKKKRKPEFTSPLYIKVIAWLRDTYKKDLTDEGNIKKIKLYRDYKFFCFSNEMKISKINIFGKLLKKAFPFIKSRRLFKHKHQFPCYFGISKNKSFPKKICNSCNESYLTQKQKNRLIKKDYKFSKELFYGTETSQNLFSGELVCQSNNIQNIYSQNIVNETKNCQNIYSQNIVNETKNLQNIYSQNIVNETKNLQNIYSPNKVNETKNLQTVYSEEFIFDQEFMCDQGTIPNVYSEKLIQNVYDKEIIPNVYEPYIQNIYSKELIYDKEIIPNVYEPNIQNVYQYNIQNVYEPEELLYDKETIPNTYSKESIYESKNSEQFKINYNFFEALKCKHESIPNIYQRESQQIEKNNYYEELQQLLNTNSSYSFIGNIF